MEHPTKDRITRIREAHPFLNATMARGMLLAQYVDFTRSPYYRGPESLQLQMEAYTDMLCRLSEHEVRNRRAFAEEYFPYNWEELEEKIDGLLDEDPRL
jgi:hypothetical protein